MIMLITMVMIIRMVARVVFASNKHLAITTQIVLMIVPDICHKYHKYMWRTNDKYQVWQISNMTNMVTCPKVVSRKDVRTSRKKDIG